MHKSAGLFLLIAFALVSVAAAQDASDKQLSTTPATNLEERTTIDIFSIDTSYVFQSEIHNDGRFGDQDAGELEVEYSHRFLLGGHIYLRAGLNYNRFEFGETLAPLPDHLQSFSALVGLEYLVGNDVGAFIQFRPGFYTEDHVGISSFDVPITVGRVFVLQPKKLFFFVGANAAFLRGEYPVLPLVGLVWRPNRQWTLNAIVPEPRIIYSPNPKIGFWVGGQLTGSSFRTDRDSNILPRKLSNAQVDYSEYRAGLGIDWNPSEQWTVTFAGGYVFERRFNFERADEEWKADGAPYLRIAMKAAF